jgi:hypothetical protein
VQGLGFMVYGSRFRVQGRGFRFWGLGTYVHGFEVIGYSLGVIGSGCLSLRSQITVFLGIGGTWCCCICGCGDPPAIWPVCPIERLLIWPI